MKTRSLVALTIQLMAIHFFLRSTLEWGPSIFSRTYAAPAFTGYRVTFCVMLVGAIFLCAFAKDLAGRMIAEGDSISLSQLTIVDCYSIAFFVLGIGFLFGSVNAVVYLLTEAFKRGIGPWRPGEAPIELWAVLQTIIPPIIGVIILVNARSLSRAYARKQGIAVAEAGGEPRIDSDHG